LSQRVIFRLSLPAVHPNIYFHFTPTSASWLNQVEIWFGIFSRKALRGASFNSLEQLRQAIEALVAAYGPTAEPFMWRKREVISDCSQRVAQAKACGYRK